MIKLEHVSKTYSGTLTSAKDVPAVTDISLHIKKGEFGFSVGDS